MWSRVGCCSVPCWVLFSMWAVPAQLCSQYGKCRWLSCPTLSTIARLPSGSSISRSGAFRDGVLSVGAGTAHGCTRRVGGTLSHPRSARAVSFGVRLRIRAHMRAHGLGRNTSHKPCASPLRPSSQSRRPRRLWPRGLCTLSARAVSRVSRFPIAAHPRLRAAQSAAWSNVCSFGFTLLR